MFASGVERALSCALGGEPAGIPRRNRGRGSRLGQLAAARHDHEVQGSLGAALPHARPRKDDVSAQPDGAIWRRRPAQKQAAGLEAQLLEADRVAGVRCHVDMGLLAAVVGHTMDDRRGGGQGPHLMPAQVAHHGPPQPALSHGQRKEHLRGREE